MDKDASEQGTNASPCVRFAVIGDYGSDSQGSEDVARLAKGWNPTLITTTGDNNYPTGEEETIDKNIGLKYSTYIYPYKGQYEQPSIHKNRFWPCLGNHDWSKKGDAGPYFNYFSALKNQHYYDFVEGNVHFFSLCSDRAHFLKDQTKKTEQMQWLEKTIQASQTPWKIVFYHHPTYSSRVRSPGGGGWPPSEVEKNGERKIDPFPKEWGVSAVFCGHHHLYERFLIDGTHYITNGLGGDTSYYEFCDDNPESLVRHAKEDGAMIIEANDEELTGQFMTVSGKIIDSFFIKK